MMSARERCRRRAVLLAGAALMAVGAACKKPDITLVLDEKDGRCQKTEAIQRTDPPPHGVPVTFAIENRCSSTQWVAVTYKGSRVLDHCSARFPMNQWFEYARGKWDAGSCHIVMEDPNNPHCHIIKIMVRSGGVRPSALAAPGGVCEAIIHDHSLDFQDVPP
jgi:hypothetical protein